MVFLTVWYFKRKTLRWVDFNWKKQGDNWLAKSDGVHKWMILENSVYIATLKNVMCDTLQAKLFGVIFCQLKFLVWY